MKRKSVVNSVQTQAIRAIITARLLFAVLLISTYSANALDITGGSNVDLDTSGINSGEPINFTSGGGTLNVNTNLSATTASSTMTVDTSTSGTVTGTSNADPFTVATTILQTGGNLTIMNPGDNNLGDFTAADNTSLTITDDTMGGTNVGTVTITSLTLNNNAANGFKIDNASSFETILSLGEISVTTAGKLIIESSGTCGTVVARTQTAIDLDVIGTGKYQSDWLSSGITSHLGTVNIAGNSAGSSIFDANFTVTQSQLEIASLNVTDNKHATINVSSGSNLIASSTTIGTGTSDAEGDKGNTTMFIGMDSSLTAATCSLGTLNMGNGTLIIDDNSGTPQALTITASTLTLTGSSMLNGNDEGVIHILKLTGDIFTSAGHILYYNGDRVKLVQNSGTEITDVNLINTAGAAAKITTTTNITADKQYQGIELATDAGATVTVSSNATAGIVGSTVLNNNTLTIVDGSTFDQLNDNNTNEADFSAASGIVNLGGTLNLANTNSMSGSNIIGTLNTDSTNAAITGNPLEITTTNIESSENLTLSNTVTISTAGTVNNAGTLTLGTGATLNTSSTSLNLGTIASTGASKINVTAGTTSAQLTGSATTDVEVAADATFATTASSNIKTLTLKGSSSSNPATLSIAAGTTAITDITTTSHGTISVTKDASLSVSNSTTIGTGTVDNQSNVGDNSLTLAADSSSSGSVTLGAINLGNGTLTLDDSNGTAASLTVSGTTLTLTGASMLNGNDEGVIHILKLTGDTFTANGHNLYYNGNRVKLVQNNGTEITSANLINTATADPQITTSTSITSDKQYKGIDLSSGTQTAITVSNNATAGIVGSTVLNNNTITIEAGSTFDQLNDNITNTADFSAGNGTLNLGGTLNLANTNTASSSNTLGTLNIIGASAEITGNALSVRAVNLDSGENLTLKNTLNFDTSSVVQSAGTLTLDGATLNSGTGSLNLGTIASGSSNSKINVTAGTTSATATAASKVSIDVATAATFNTAATSTLDTVTLKGSTSSNTAHLSIAAGTTTLDELVADGHGCVSVTKDASLTVSTGTTVGTGTASDQDSTGNNTLTIQEDHTSSGSVSLGAVTLGNGTLIIDDSNTAADVLTISADSLTLTGASMLCGNDAGVIHKLKVADNTLTDAGKYLYYNSTNILLVGSDGTTPVSSANLRDIADIQSTLTATTTISADCEYAGINFAPTDDYISNNAIIINNKATVGIFGNTSITKNGHLIINNGATLNQLNDQTTHTADFTFDSTGYIGLVNGTLNLANTNSTGNTNYISKLITLNFPSDISDIPYLIANNVTVNQLGTLDSSIIGLQGKISVNELLFNSNNNNYNDNFNYDSSMIVLNQADLTLNAYSKSYPDVRCIATNSGNKLTSYTITYYQYLEVLDGTLDIYSTPANQGLGKGFNQSGSVIVNAKTSDATLTLHDSHGTLSLSSTTKLNGTNTDSTSYTATLDVSDTTDILRYTTITPTGFAKIITNQTQPQSNISSINFNEGGTLYLPRDSENILSIDTYYSNNGTLDITGTTATAKSVIRLNSSLFQGSSTLIADGDGSGGKDKIYFLGPSLGLYGTLLYDSSKVELLDSSGNTLTNANLLDTANAQDESVGAGQNFHVTKNAILHNLDGSASNAGVTVESGKTLVATGTTTTGSNTITVGEDATFNSQGTIAAADGTVSLANNSTLTVNGTSNEVSTVEATGTVTINGSGTVKTKELSGDANTVVQISGNATVDTTQSTQTTSVGKTVITGSATLVTGSAQYSTTVLQITGPDDGTTNVKLTGIGEATSRLIADTASFETTTAVTDTTVSIIDGQLPMSANTLKLTDSTLILGSTVYITGVNPAVNDSHIEVLGAAAGNTSTIDNHSTMQANLLGLLDVISGSTAGYTATLDIDNTEATDSVFKFTTVNVIGDATGGSATLNFKATGNTNSVIQDIDLTTLNINGVDATGTATVTSQQHVDLSIGTLNFYGTNGVFDNQVAYAATSASTAKIGSINIGSNYGDAVTGTLNATVSDAKTSITTVTLSGGTNAGQLNLSGTDASDLFEITTLNLAGADAVTDAVLAVNNNSTANIQTTVLNSGKFGTINNNANTTFIDGTINGTLKITGAALNPDNGTFTIGSTGQLDVSANNMTVDNSDKLVFNLGTSSDSSDNIVDTAGSYATLLGNVTTTRSGTTLDRVYGVNGVSDQTYLDVVTFAGGTGAVVDDELQTDDYLRTYTLKDEDGQGDAFDILVATNSSGITNAVQEAGGTGQDATDLEELVNRQASASAAAGVYIDQVFAMSPKQQVRAMEEKRGEDATTASTQSSLLTISAAASAVKSQMTSFRSGNLASAMSSSFSSSGATSALSDMADAKTLAAAYESAEYNPAATATYGKTQVWANGFGGFGEQGTTDGSTGYDFYNAGTMVGIDYAFAQELRIGALLGYSYNKTDGYANSGNSTDNIIRLGAYASYNWDNLFIDLSPTCGIHIIDAKRNLNTGATATGERTGVDFNINTTIGYSFKLPQEIMLTPSYSLGYTLYYDPEYTETGSGVQNNNFASFTSNSLLQDLGVRLGRLFRQSENLAFLPEVWGGWEVEYLNTGGNRNSTTSAALFSNTYSTSMNGMATNRGYWGGGLTALINDNISVFGRYDQKIWDSGYNVGFSAGIKIIF